MKWYKIPNFPGYEITRCGKLRNSKTTREFTFNKTGKYLRACLKQSGKLRTMTLHSLLLETFVGPRPDGHVSCHIDDNPRNNSLTNLMWGTPEENRRQAKVNNRIPCAGKRGFELMKPFFTAQELWLDRETPIQTCQLIADYCNAKLERESKKVVCRITDGKWQCDEHPGFARATHTALLICEEGIEK